MKASDLDEVNDLMVDIRSLSGEISKIETIQELKLLDDSTTYLQVRILQGHRSIFEDWANDLKINPEEVLSKCLEEKKIKLEGKQDKLTALGVELDVGVMANDQEM